MHDKRIAVSLLILLLGCSSSVSVGTATRHRTIETVETHWPRYTTDVAPALGAPLPQCASSRIMYVAASAQTWPACLAFHAGIQYIVGVNHEGVIKYIETSHPDFVSPEGLRVGSTLAQVRAAGGSEPIGETGWAHYACLPSGWCARFPGIGNIEPGSDSQVAAFFRR